MEIKKLPSIPQLERDDDAGAYVYPKEYQNKLFEHQNQYIYFKTSSYDTFPKAILDIIIQHSLDEMDFSQFEPEQAITEDSIQNLISNHIEQIQQQFDQKIAEKVQETTTSFLNEIMEKTEHLINNKFEEIINNFNARFEKFDNRIKEDFATADDIGELSVNVEQKIAAFQKNIQYDSSKIKEVVNGELQVVKDNMEDVIRSSIEQILNEKEKDKVNIAENLETSPTTEKVQNVEQITSTVLEQPITNQKVSLGTLISLKEGGFGVEEISHLKSLGLV